MTCANGNIAEKCNKWLTVGNIYSPLSFNSTFVQFDIWLFHFLHPFSFNSTYSTSKFQLLRARHSFNSTLVTKENHKVFRFSVRLSHEIPKCPRSGQGKMKQMWNPVASHTKSSTVLHFFDREGARGLLNRYKFDKDTFARNFIVTVVKNTL